MQLVIVLDHGAIGREVYRLDDIVNFAHSRWRHVFWQGPQPKLNVVRDMAYFYATRSIPQYDTTRDVGEQTAVTYADRMKLAGLGPMQSGTVERTMPGPGGRDDIGILPRWSALYLLTQNPDMLDVVLGTGDISGSIPIHYRDERTGERPRETLPTTGWGDGASSQLYC